jgi:hypothetical protein
VTTTRPRIRFPEPDQAALDWLVDHRVAEAPRSYETCLHCLHTWHGMRCTSCVCASSAIPVDCTWRAHRTWSDEVKTLQIMTDTGCDGWVARRVLAWQKTTSYFGIVSALYGRGL